MNVAFKVLGTDGTSQPLAQAPASVLAGASSSPIVNRSVTTCTRREAAKAGIVDAVDGAVLLQRPVGEASSR